MTKVLDLLFRVPLTKPYCNLIFFLRKLTKNKNSLICLSVTPMSQLQSNLRLDKGLSSFESSGSWYFPQMLVEEYHF